MKIKLGVIFGGETVEHEVSIITALQAIEHINKDKYDVVPIYISKDRIWYTGDMLKDIDIYKERKTEREIERDIYIQMTYRQGINKQHKLEQQKKRFK